MSRQPSMFKSVAVHECWEIKSHNEEFCAPKQIFGFHAAPRMTRNQYLPVGGLAGSCMRSRMFEFGSKFSVCMEKIRRNKDDEYRYALARVS